MTTLVPTIETTAERTDSLGPANPKMEAVLDLARRFGPIWPQSPGKTGYRGSGGSRDATRDEATIRRLWTTHPEAVPALMTGNANGIVALDVDVKNGRNGIDTLELLGVPYHPVTPTAHTPSGGIHMLFRSQGHPVRTTIDELGPGLEVKGDGSWITLPPGPGRYWDEHLGPETSLADMPPWMVGEEPKEEPQPKARPRATAGLSRYGEAALDGAVKRITTAGAGEQELTLNAECFAIGRLAGGGVIPSGLAIEALLWAARRMPSHDPRRPWRPSDLARKVKTTFSDGLRQPRGMPNG